MVVGLRTKQVSVGSLPKDSQLQIRGRVQPHLQERGRRAADLFDA
jgi:hypothetical protein